MIKSHVLSALTEDNQRLRRRNTMLLSELSHMTKLYNDIIYFLQNHVAPVPIMDQHRPNTPATTTPTPTHQGPKLIELDPSSPEATPHHENLKLFGVSKYYEKIKKKKGDGGGRGSEDNNDDADGDVEEEVEDAIPEVVTSRMMRRMGFSVGIPLLVGLFFFPFFYYLKVVVKLDVPTWIPSIVSLFFFGSGLLGVSYGIVSSSWDPLREGSLLGWNEAQKNWRVFWQSLWGKPGKK